MTTEGNASRRRRRGGRVTRWSGDSLFFRALEPEEGWDESRTAVWANQRARMLDAMARAVAAKGYARVSVADVVQLAGVSRRTFYEQFRDKEDCFLVAYETGSEALIGEMLAAVARLENPDWRTRLRASMEVYTATLAAEPDLARVFLIDVLGAGPKAVELRRRVYERYVEQYRVLSALAAEEDPGIAPVPDLFLRALVGGIGELVQAQILDHGAEKVTDLTADLLALVTAIFEGTARLR